MANVNVKDAAGSTVGIAVPELVVGALPITEGANATPVTGAAMPAGGVGLTGWLSAIWLKIAGVLRVGGSTVIATANFTRPADTTAYASGDIVANSTTAGSVAALQFTAARVNGGSGRITRARLKKSGVTTTNAQFRLHLYASDPALSSGIANGDNGAWATKYAGYLGAFDITVDRVFSDASEGAGVPLAGPFIPFVAGGGSQVIYGLVEARAAYTPVSAETFTGSLDIDQD